MSRGAAGGFEACELSGFFHDVHEIQAGLREAWDSLRDLRYLVQGEQDRASAIEAAAKDDHDRLLETGERLANLKRQVEHALSIGNLAIKDSADAGARLTQACCQLGNHDGQLTDLRARLETLEHKAGQSGDHIEHLRGTTTDAHSRLDAVLGNLQQHAGELRGCQGAAARLEERLSVAEDHSRSLSTAHDETVNSLSNLVNLTINPALEKAEEDRTWLHAVDARVVALEACSAELEDKTAQLAKAGDLARADLQDLRSRAGELTTSTRQMQDELTQASIEARADREQLDDACRHIKELQAGARETSFALRRARQEVADVQKDNRQRTEQVHGLAEELAALGHGLSVTDGEVCSLEALLEGVPSQAA